ncbi:MAG: hypothetical protein LH614_07950 [Pyrinomonadaceae bacterium]|nr:hypothetical protein [Pyrinomonadaceae bacterium]
MRASIFDTELTDSLTGIASYRAFLGVRVGRTVAERMLTVRANDGWNVTPPPYVLSMAAGNWQPIVPSTAAGFTQFPGVLPFAITSGTRFAPNPPPAMTSDEYARD